MGVKVCLPVDSGGLDEGGKTCRPNDVSLCCTKLVGLTTYASLSLMSFMVEVVPLPGLGNV